MAPYLEGRAAVVTGAGGGIGRAIAMALAAEGAKVVVNDIGGSIEGAGASAKPADGVVQEIAAAGGVAVANYDDVSDFGAAGRIVQTCIDRFGSIDILVNNAGINRPGWFYEMEERDFDDVVRVHLKGAFNCSRHACQPMMARRFGRIVNISSAAGLVGSTERVNYGAAKGGIFGMTNTMARDLGHFGVTVNAVCPGPTDTRMLRNSIRRAVQARETRPLTAFERSSQLFRVQPQPPEHLAPLVVFLCTEAAGEVNGQLFGSTGSRFSWYEPLTVARSIYKEGRWTQEELAKVMPASLTQGLVNPSPPGSEREA